MISRVYLLATALLGLDHSSWDAMLKDYVNAESRVDYKRWRETSDALEAYLAHLAQPWPGDLTEDDRKASLINAYNAITIRWILAHYPVESIWKTKKPFSGARHTVNGEKTSLDRIESTLRKMDPLIHSALVCAARSCPPLRREAYLGSRVNAQLEDNTRAWLANPTLNEFDGPARTARISSIFKWYGDDFEAGGLRAFLIKFAPAGKAGFLAEGKGKIDYQRYHWGLNDQRAIGEDYPNTIGLWWDYFRNR